MPRILAFDPNLKFDIILHDFPVQLPTLSELLFRYDEDTRSVGEVNEQNQKKEWNIFYNKQMKLRRVSGRAFFFL